MRTFEDVSVGSIQFAVQAHPDGGRSFLDLAKRLESLGFSALYLPDHPGTTAAPFVALAAAASVTSSLRLGTCVVNAGAWDPLPLATEAATLEHLAEGRAVLGVGAGHTPSEWTMRGRSCPPAPDRIARMMEVVDATRRLLAGERVTTRGEHVTLEDAQLGWPQQPSASIPLMIGGNAKALLRYAARVADIVELTGLGRTLEDGHRHETSWNRRVIDDRIALVRDAAGGRGVSLSSLVQHVAITSDRGAAAEAFCGRLRTVLSAEAAPTPDAVLGCPYVMLGTAEEIAEQLQVQREGWGFDRYTIRTEAVDDVLRVRELLDE